MTQLNKIPITIKSPAFKKFMARLDSIVKDVKIITNKKN